MSRPEHEKMLLPHAVYRFYNSARELLYVGCSHNFFGRMAVHAHTQPWIKDIAHIQIEWFSDQLEGRRAEAQVILAENPRHNRLRIEPDAVGTTEMRVHGQPPRGNGEFCPKCSKPKERRVAAYCNACYKDYVRRRKLERAAGIVTAR